MEEKYEDILKDTINELKEVLGNMEDNQKKDDRIEELRTELQANDILENWNAFYQEMGEAPLLEENFNKKEAIEELKQLLEEQSKNSPIKQLADIRNGLNEVVKNEKEEIDKMDARIEELRTELQENDEMESLNAFYEGEDKLENSFNKEEAIEELKQLLADREKMEKERSALEAFANLISMDKVDKLEKYVKKYDELFVEKTTIKEYETEEILSAEDGISSGHIEKIEVKDEDVIKPQPVINMEYIEKVQQEPTRISQGTIFLDGKEQREDITVGEIKEITENEQDLEEQSNAREYNEEKQQENTTGKIEQDERLVERFYEMEAAVGFDKELLSQDYINLKEAFLDKGLVAEFGSVEERLEKLKGATLLSIYEGQKELYELGSQERKEIEELIEKVKAKMLENQKVDTVIKEQETQLETEQEKASSEYIERIEVADDEIKKPEPIKTMDDLSQKRTPATMSESEKRRQEKLQQLYGMVIDMSQGYVDILDKYEYLNKYYAKVFTYLSETSIENEIERLEGSNVIDSIKEMISEKQKHNDGRLNDEDIEELTSMLKEIEERKNELEKKAKEELAKQTSTKNKNKENGNGQREQTKKTAPEQQVAKKTQEGTPQTSSVKAEASTGLGISNISIGTEIIITYSDNSRSMIPFRKMKKDLFIKTEEKAKKINQMYGSTMTWMNRGMVLDKVDPMIVDALMLTKEKGVSSEKINSIFRTYVQAIEYRGEDGEEARGVTKSILTYDKRGMLGIVGNIFRTKEYRKLKYNADKAEEFAEIIEDDKAEKARDRIAKKEERKSKKEEKAKKRRERKREKALAKEEKKLLGKEKQKAFPIYDEQNDSEYSESDEPYLNESSGKKEVCERVSDETMKKIIELGRNYRDSEGRHIDATEREEGEKIVD